MKLIPEPIQNIHTVTVRNWSELYYKNDTVLMDAHNAWVGLDDFRKKARRNKMYTFEDQWGDRIKVGCKSMTERESIIKQGNSF